MVLFMTPTEDNHIEIKVGYVTFEIDVFADSKTGSITSHNLCCEDNVDDEDAITYNHMMDALESLILAHACAGVDVTTPEYIEGIKTAIESCANNI
jgi:hypothetical protein